jgi:DNA-binding MarR family transcriptional regulator
VAAVEWNGGCSGWLIADAFVRVAELAMHELFFGLKRAFHGTLRMTRIALASLGLTPARFDMLYIVLKERSMMSQRDLQRALGVAAATVSRMLKSLEKLGFVERTVMEEDHRCRYVVLTKAGRRRVLEAARWLIHSGNIQLMVDSALSPDRWYDPAACRRVRDELGRVLHLLRHAYRDVATRHYPHAPVDLFAHLPRVYIGPSESGY